jgi:O-antigen ligase
VRGAGALAARRAFAVTVLVPLRALPVPEVMTVASPGLALLVVWVCRARPSAAAAAGRGGLWRLCMLYGLVTWLLVGTVASRFIDHSLAWSATFALSVLLPLFVLPDAKSVDLLKRTWLVLAAVLAVFAVIEFVMHANPVYGELYARGEYPLVQNWSVYRVTTTLGHPLTNGLFFAMSCGLAFGEYWRTGRLPLFALAALSGVGLTLTASRGSLLAAGAAGLAVMACGLLVLRAGRRGLRLLIALIAVAGLVAIAQTDILRDRNSSAEGQVSTSDRSAAFDVAMGTAEDTHWLGTGPGTSNPATRGDVSNGLIIESSYLFVLLLGTSGVAAYRRGRAGELGALCAYAVAAAGFNLLEANRPAHVLLGLALLLCWAPDDRLPAASRADAVAEAPRPLLAAARAPGALTVGVRA